MEIKNSPNKIKVKLTVEVEAEFYDNESDEETVRYCVEQDLEDAGLNVIDVSIDDTREIDTDTCTTSEQQKFQNIEKEIECLAVQTDCPVYLGDKEVDSYVKLSDVLNMLKNYE